MQSELVSPMDREKVAIALETVQQNFVAPCNYYPLYQVTLESEDNELTTIKYRKSFVKYILDENYSAAELSTDFESSMRADHESGSNVLDFDDEVRSRNATINY